MYTLMRLMPARRFAMQQVPTLGLALLIAEMFYKFHSFILEAIAFLATWFVIDACLQGIAAVTERLIRWRRQTKVGHQTTIT